MSVLTDYNDESKGSIRLYLRIYGVERKKFKRLNKKISEKANMLYLVDYRENTREFYGGK